MLRLKRETTIGKYFLIILDMDYYYDGINYTREELAKRFENGQKLQNQTPDERGKISLSMVEGEKVLDVGCAAGIQSLTLAKMGFTVHAIDVLEESIKIAKEFNSSPKITYEVRDILKQSFPEKSFDCIIFLETIEHVENPALFFREFHRILKDGGHLIVSTPNSTSLKNTLYALSYRKKHKQNKLIKEFTSELKNTGTQLEHIYNWDFPTLGRLLYKCGFDITDNGFARSGPIIIPFFGKKIKIISMNSRILNKFPSLKTTLVFKAKKR